MVSIASGLTTENDKKRAGSMAMWLASIRMYHHLSRDISLFLILSIMSRLGKWLPYTTIGDIHSTHSREMSGRSCVAGLQDVLVEPVYLYLEIHLRKVIPYLVIIGNPRSIRI